MYHPSMSALKWATAALGMAGKMISQATVFARVLCSLLFLILLACQQPYQQGRRFEANWCYFKDGNLVIHRIGPKGDVCEKKGGQWVADGQTSVLRQHNFKDSGADKAK